ncbi:MAG TPA: bifunctional 3,4-dihydroxy-2-butanone-4-phosphate synthase/GTP cyclohydrolase II [Burkholderiales bacterium]|nr:bifunctional 3,4-dihydroxy-2-butanone-4-phosphate synthase/GTP cyclohydrolase II [Burkholderiales bacterium]
MKGISPIEEIIGEVRAGRMVILVDEADRENEGDLVLAADCVTPNHINFMARYGRGLICLTLTEARCRQLHLPLMVTNNRTPYGTNFTLSIEASEGVTTGISAADRAKTIQAAVKPDARPENIIQPGHIFPLMAHNGGVLVRAGHTEAGCDIAQLAGLSPASVICEILKDDGEMARLPDLIEFGRLHGLKIGTIADLIHYRSLTETLVERRAVRDVMTPQGPFKLYAYHDKPANETHLALVHGNIDPEEDVLVRVHEPLSVLDFLDESIGGHTFGLQESMARIQAEEAGVLVLLRRHESSGDILTRLSGSGDVHYVDRQMDLRHFGIGAQILKDLNVHRMRLLALPRKMPNMAGFDLVVSGFVESEGEK